MEGCSQKALHSYQTCQVYERLEGDILPINGIFETNNLGG